MKSVVAEAGGIWAVAEQRMSQQTVAVLSLVLEVATGADLCPINLRSQEDIVHAEDRSSCMHHWTGP